MAKFLSYKSSATSSCYQEHSALSQDLKVGLLDVSSEKRGFLFLFIFGRENYLINHLLIHLFANLSTEVGYDFAT